MVHGMYRNEAIAANSKTVVASCFAEPCSGFVRLQVLPARSHKGMGFECSKSSGMNCDLPVCGSYRFPQRL